MQKLLSLIRSLFFPPLFYEVDPERSYCSLCGSACIYLYEFYSVQSYT